MARAIPILFITHPFHINVLLVSKITGGISIFLYGTPLLSLQQAWADTSEPQSLRAVPQKNCLDGQSQGVVVN